MSRLFTLFWGEKEIPMVEQVCRLDLTVAAMEYLEYAMQQNGTKQGVPNFVAYTTAMNMLHIAEFYDDFEQAMLCQYIQEKRNENI